MQLLLVGDEHSIRGLACKPVTRSKASSKASIKARSKGLRMSPVPSCLCSYFSSVMNMPFGAYVHAYADVCGRMLTYASLRSSFVPVQLLLVSDERAIRGLHASHRRLHRAYGYQ